MRRVQVELLLLQLCAFAAADIVYVTDLPAYSSLAPCAAEAVSYHIQGLTESTCPQGVTALESCACTQDNNAASVASGIASNVLYYCSSTATEDVASASAVFSRYCNQGSPGPAVTPAPTLVSQYISDLSAYSNLVGPYIPAISPTLTLTFIRHLAPRAALAMLSLPSPKLSAQVVNRR
jgi:hypothetical protein